MVVVVNEVPRGVVELVFVLIGEIDALQADPEVVGYVVLGRRVEVECRIVAVGARADLLPWNLGQVAAPVRPGDALRTEAEILNVRNSNSRPDFGVVRSRTTVFNQRDEVVMRSVVNFLAPRRKT